jgi:YidC/Oxa1 family membrane protein insertase
MGMDRNTLIGFVLIGALLIAMFVMNSKNRLAYEGEQKRIADSVAALQPKIDSSLVKLDSLKTDSIHSVQTKSIFQNNKVDLQDVVLENEVMKINFTNKGAQPQTVILKKYKKFDSSLVVLQSGDFNKLNYRINVNQNQSAEITDIIFQPLPVVDNADHSSTLSFVAQDSIGKKIIHRYTIKPNDYMIDFDMEVYGADQLFSQNSINLIWQLQTNLIEKDRTYESNQTYICYLEKENYDFSYISKPDTKAFTENVNWIGVKQQFFINAIISKNKFKNVSANWSVPEDTTHQYYLARTTTTALVPLTGFSSKQIIPFQMYFGPSDYNILKKYDNQMENMVPLGSGIFAFVKYINRVFLLPVFSWLEQHIANMGIVILLLTLLIRLITSPILYKSYLSGAKMKVLKPEVDALREKYKDDQQAFGMEQMKLWKSAGVSPLGGCLPALLQIPIFMSLYYFFQSSIDLRGQSFLWAHDLAAYDSIAQLPFNIPFYGDHVSLFTLTAVITSLLISILGMSNMQDNSNPMMKYMPYIFPVMLLGVFNKLPSALTWYYTISNTITLILQIVIQKYIIDHNKIMVEIAENRKKPVKKSKMQERIEAMQESQKKLQDMKKKG